MDENETSNLVDLSAMYFIETESGQKLIEKERYIFTRRFGQDLKDVSQRLHALDQRSLSSVKSTGRQLEIMIVKN